MSLRSTFFPYRRLLCRFFTLLLYGKLNENRQSKAAQNIQESISCSEQYEYQIKYNIENERI